MGQAPWHPCVPWYAQAMFDWCFWSRWGNPHQCHGPHLAHHQPFQSFKRQLLGILESREFCTGTVSHWWRVNHHVPKQSQDLDLSRYFMARCLDFSCQQCLLPDHPKQYSTEHQMRCRVFLEVFTFTVAGFRDSDSILYVSNLNDSICFTNPKSALLTGTVLLLYVISVLVQTTRLQKAERWWTVNQTLAHFRLQKWCGFGWLGFFLPCAKLEKYIYFFWGRDHTPAHRKEHNCLPSMPQTPKKIKYQPFALTFPLGAVTNEQCWSMPSLLTCLFLSVTNNLFLASCPGDLNQSSMKS